MEKSKLSTGSSGSCGKIDGLKNKPPIPSYNEEKEVLFMKKKAVYYYNKGYNCSQCILKAAEVHFNLKMSKDCYDLCKGLNTGLGIGGSCSLISAATMVFGLMFDEGTVIRLRMHFIDEFQDKYKVVNCSQLKRLRDYYGNCSTIIGEAAAIIEKLIEEEKKHF